MKILAIVHPCDKFVAPTGLGYGVAPYRACASCGFCEIIHGLTGEELLARGLWDWCRYTPGMEDEPPRKAWLKLQADLAGIEGAPSADEVLRATINAPLAA